MRTRLRARFFVLPSTPLPTENPLLQPELHFLLTVINCCGYFNPLTIVDTPMKKQLFFFAFFFTFP